MKQNRFFLFSLLLITPCNASFQETKTEPIILSHTFPSTPKQNDTAQDIAIRAGIFAALAGTLYGAAQLSGYADQTLLGTTIGDYANGMSIGLLWEAIKRGYHGNPTTDIQTDIINTFAWQAGSTATYAAYNHGCQKLATTLKTDDAGIIPMCRNGAAMIIEPFKIQKGIWQKSVAGIIALQAGLWWLKPEKKIETLHTQVAQVFNDLKFKEFVQTLKTTNQETLYINFPDHRFAAAYFTEEGNLELAEALRSGELSHENNPLPINVAKAKISPFFSSWITSCEQRLVEAEKTVLLQKGFIKAISSNLLCSLGVLSDQPFLTQKAMVYAINEFFNELRQTLQTQKNTSTKSPFKPLLAEINNPHN